MTYARVVLRGQPHARLDSERSSDWLLNRAAAEMVPVEPGSTPGQRQWPRGTRRAGMVALPGGSPPAERNEKTVTGSMNHEVVGRRAG